MDLSLLRRRLRASLPGRLLLRAASWAYGAGVWARQLAYDAGLRPSRKLPVRTVCIGNLTAGGTGKTPAVLLAAEFLRERRQRVAILTRGYRRPRRGEEPVKVLLKDSCSWEEVGDEPWMMHQALRGLEVPVLVCPDRYRAGQTALRHYQPQTILLDDGFQHLRLRRDLDIVLLSALDPFGGEHLLPLGDLREPARALRRAHLAVLTHADQVSEGRLEALRRRVQQLRPGLGMVEAVHRPDHFFDLKAETKRKLTYLKNKPAACFSGLGDPRPFKEGLRRVESRLVQVWRFPDHHPYTLSELRSIENVRRGAALVTTFKDFARLPRGWQGVLSGEVLALAVRMEIVKGKSLWEAALCGERAGA